MTILLLALILLTLLFGAGLVLGWLANIVGAVLGFALMAAIGLTLLSLFGEFGLICFCIGLATVLIVAKLWADEVELKDAERESAAAEKSRNEAARVLQRFSDEALESVRPEPSREEVMAQARSKRARRTKAKRGIFPNRQHP